MPSSKQKLILGIDAGGTKTDLVLADENEKILAKHKTGQGNLHNASDEDIIEEFRDGVRELYKKAGIASKKKISALGAGLAGLDCPADQKRAENIIQQSCKGILPPKKNRKIVNDTIIGFWSGSEKKEGICLIGGTGSNCYGRVKSGKEAWASGLGRVLADQGGGYYQGSRALKAAAKSYDGRGPKTTLEKKITKYYNVSSIRELVPIVHQPDYGKSDIGELGYLVEKAAKEGDKVAKQIADDSADELVLMVQTVAEKLGLRKKTFDLVLIGGVIQKDPIVQKRFKRRVKKLFKEPRFIIPEQKPVMGAVRLAVHTLQQTGIAGSKATGSP